MSQIVYDNPKSKFSIISIVFFAVMLIGVAIPLFDVYPLVDALSLHPDEWRRFLGVNLLSHVFIHRSLEHWALSLMPLMAFGFLIQRRVSSQRFAILTVLGAVAAATMQTTGALYFSLGENNEFFQENYLAGASGLAMAYMGFYGIALIEKDLDYLPVIILLLLPAFTGWFIYTDFAIQVAFLSHIGGLACGMLVGGFTRFQIFREAYVGPESINSEIKRNAA